MPAPAAASTTKKHGKRPKCPPKCPPPTPPSPIRGLIMQFLRAIFIVFSSDKAPSEQFIEQSPMLQKYRSSIAFSGEWNSKGRELLVLLEALGLKEDTLSPIENRFFYRILPMLQNSYSEQFEHEYNKMKQAHPGYPTFKKFCCYMLPTPVGNSDSNVEVYLRHKFEEPAVSVESYFPGTFELGVSPAELSNETEKLTSPQKAELVNMGLQKFMEKYPRVICPVSKRSVWDVPSTPWGSGNKPPTLFLDIKPQMLVQMVHPPVKVCACGMTSSNLGGFLGSLPKNPVDVLNRRDGSRLKKAPTDKDFKHCLVCACPVCNRWITWESLVTKHAQTFYSSKWVEGIFKTLVEKARLLFPSKDCYSCSDLTPYDKQKHDECVNTHSECICQGCESDRTTLRNSEDTAGSLISRHLHKCNYCNNWHPTVMGQYLKEVPENHQVRRCLECTCLFHQALECGGEEIPPICQPCVDRKEREKQRKEREKQFRSCSWCGTCCQLDSGCDLICCGCDYTGNPITMVDREGHPILDKEGKRILMGCGKRFCFGCGAKFDNNQMDWKCTCYIEGTKNPKQYRPEETSTCYEKRYGNPYSPQDSEAPPLPPAYILDEYERLAAELSVMHDGHTEHEHTYAPHAPQRSSRPRIVQDLDMDIDPETLLRFFSTFDD